jgi:hypothetical protein
MSQIVGNGHLCCGRHCKGCRDPRAKPSSVGPEAVNSPVGRLEGDLVRLTVELAGCPLWRVEMLFGRANFCYRGIQIGCCLKGK